MSRIRTARLVVLAFLGIFAVAILVSILRNVPEETAVPQSRPVPDAPSQIPVEGVVESAAETFLFTEERAGQVVTRLRAGRMLGEEDGSRVLSDISIEFCPEPATHPDELARIAGAAGRFDAVNQSVQLLDLVHIQLASGETMDTSSLTYSMKDRIATTDDPVRFRLDGFSGTAQGLTARLQEEQLSLHSAVRVVPLDSTSERSMSVSSDSLEYNGRARITHLGGRVVLAGTWGRFTGQDLVIDESGEAVLARSSGQGELRLEKAGDSARFLLTGRQWLFQLDEARQLQSVETASDALLVPGESEHGLPLRRLAAARMVLTPASATQTRDTLVATGRQGMAVQALLAEGPLDEVTSASLHLELGPEDSGWARFSGDVQGAGPGRSVRGRELKAYQDGRIQLRGDADMPARLVEPLRSLAALEIDYDGGGNGTASGDVHLNGSQAAGAQRIAAISQYASFDGTTGLMRLEGQVRAWQGSDTLQASWLALDRESEVIHAGGGVTTSLGSRAQAEGQLRASARTRVSASGLIWERQEESARFDGDVLLTRAGMMLQSVSLEMSTGGSGTRAFNAAGAVRLSDSAWKGSGDRLYTAGGEDVYHLESATGLATVTTLPSGITLKGAHLRVDPETGVAQVDSLPGGRITLSSRNTPVKEQP